jgi:hypothetical protein
LLTFIPGSGIRIPSADRIEQGCETRKFEDGSGSGIFSDYGSGTSSASGSLKKQTHCNYEREKRQTASGE